MSFSLTGCKKSTKETVNWDLPAFYLQENENSKTSLKLNDILQDPDTKFMLFYIWTSDDLKKEHADYPLINFPILWDQKGAVVKQYKLEVIPSCILTCIPFNL